MKARPRNLIWVPPGAPPAQEPVAPCIDLKGYLPMPEPFPIGTMDAFPREFLPQCHAEADRRAVQDGRG